MPIIILFSELDLMFILFLDTHIGKFNLFENIYDKNYKITSVLIAMFD